MRKRSWMLLPVLLGALTGYVLRPSPADSACCYSPGGLGIPTTS
jgi:hypothetical protein